MTLEVVGAVDVGGFVVAVDLSVERGETVALVGPNGAGKSTVLRSVAGLTALTRGRIVLDDAVWDEPSTRRFVPPERRRVGLVFQQYRLFGHMTALENVAFGLRASGVDRHAARRAAGSMLERFDLATVGDRLPSALSGGQAQRVALARALVIEPSVLLLDEPMAALDVTARGAVRHDLQQWIGGVDAHRIVVTHDPVDAQALADRVVVLEGGRISQTGSMADLAAAPRSSYVADLLGTNLVRGDLFDGGLTTVDGMVLSVGAHDVVDGPVVATVRPAAVALHRTRPEGSPRNVWATTVDSVDVGTERVRVRLAAPLALVVEVTPAGLAALEVGPGDEVWASVKASEVGLVADA